MTPGWIRGSIWFPTRAEAKLYLFEYIEVFYDHQRHQTVLGHRTPIEYAATVTVYTPCPPNRVRLRVGSRGTARSPWWAAQAARGRLPVLRAVRACGWHRRSRWIRCGLVAG